MKYYTNHFLHAIFTLCLLFASFSIEGQCSCPNKEYTSNCEEEKVITAGNGSNITDVLHEAVTNYCRVRLANFSSGDVYYFTFPQVFRDIDHKEIVLDAGVTLLGLPGAFSDCSQSVLTFEGESVHDIIIRGDYCQGETKPTIAMGETNYQSFDDTGFLVGADDDGEPYLNNQGQPNYIFSDGDSDPYFDNSGIPNFITNNSQLRVQQDCEYNDFLCNRKIVVWCPYTWEARHIVSLQGVQDFWIEDLNISNASGGDGIHITDDQDFNVSNQVYITNVDFNDNARNGLKITNAHCVKLLDLDFHNNGNIAPSNLVTTEAAFNIDQNTSPGSVDDYMGTPPNYALHNISFENGYFIGNSFRDMSFDVPIQLTLCDELFDLKVNDVCISESVDAIVFEQSNEEQAGTLKFYDVGINEFEKAVEVTPEWNSSQVNITLKDWTVERSGGVVNNAFDINSSSFCGTTSISDICKSSNIVDDLCQPSNCTTKSYTCGQNIGPDCGGNSGICDFNVTTQEEETIGIECECDYLFMIDESVSVSDDEWEDMNCSINNMMNELDSICEQSCDTRFALLQWSGIISQVLGSDFDCSPFEFDRVFQDATHPGAALQFLLELLQMPEVFQPNEKCLKVLIFTDAECIIWDIFDTGPIADLIKTNFPFVEFIFVDYTTFGDLSECSEIDDIISDNDGNVDKDDVIQSEFDCETGIGVDDLIDTTTTYTIFIDIDPDCKDPKIVWSAYDGGLILTTSSDQTSVTVNGNGFYTVEVICASGCINYFFEVVEFSNSSKTADITAIVKKDRTRYYEGKAYTPHEFEMLMLNKSEIVDEQAIQISPNPFVDQLNILLPNAVDNYNLLIFDLKGQLVHKSNSISGISHELDLGHLEDGVYLVNLLNTRTLENTSKKVLRMTE